MKKYYIAYGSNMHLRQMTYRCPYAILHATGVLRGWRLVFRGSKTGAYATIEQSESQDVPVVIWEVTPICERSLDFYEGYPSFYQKQLLTVELDSSTIQGMVYIMDERCLPGRPSSRYVETVWQGYTDNGIDTVPLAEALAYNECECNA